MVSIHSTQTLLCTNLNQKMPVEKCEHDIKYKSHYTTIQISDETGILFDMQKV
jgi:hypothetical protein